MIHAIETKQIKELSSELIEPYIKGFMGTMIDFFASAYITKEEQEAVGRGCGWTVDELKKWLRGVDVFISVTSGIHARMAASNEFQKMIQMDNKELKEMCRKIVMENLTGE